MYVLAKIEVFKQHFRTGYYQPCMLNTTAGAVLQWGACAMRMLRRYLVAPYHRNLSINRKGTYILADIHGMDHFCPKLAPQPI
jgi:hypothetical protein